MIPQFIKLTDVDGEPVLVNLALVAFVETDVTLDATDPPGSFLYIVNGTASYDIQWVRESIAAIEAAIRTLREGA